MGNIMDAYIYRAALYCGPCAAQIRADLTNVAQTPQDLKYLNGCGDSDHFPQGPYLDGGGEADSPQHCDGCHVFLENPLTSDGDDYVRERLEFGDGDSEVLATWGSFYDYLRVE